MFSYIELLYIFLIAIAFVLLFRFQKSFFKKYYFSNIELAFENKVSYRMFLARYIFIFLFGLLSYWIFGSIDIILIGSFLGSFLVVWPALLSPRNAYNEIFEHKDIIKIYVIHSIFMITTISTAYIAALVFPIIRDDLNLREQIPGALLWLTISVFGNPIEFIFKKNLDKSLKNKQIFKDDIDE